MLYPKTSRTRRIVDMNGLWKFCFDPESEGLNKNWNNGLDPNRTVEMPVPASFNDFFTDKESREYTGDFWYETSVFVPGEWEGKNISLRFDCATHRAVVYVNGEKIVTHEGGFLPFTARINDVVNWNGYNRVVVCLNNELSYATLPAGSTKVFSDGTKMSKPFFDFYNYSGLQRPVRLVVTPKDEIVDFSVNHILEGTDSITEYVVTTDSGKPASLGSDKLTSNGSGKLASNGSDKLAPNGSGKLAPNGSGKLASNGSDKKVLIRVYDERRNLVAEASGAEGQIRIRDVRLWEVRNAYLYTFQILLMDQETILDEYEEEVGIRTIEVKDTDILINKKPVYLKGFGKHEDSEINGRGFNLAVVKRDFELMKWIGANSFRTSHYPYAEEIIQMADREGFLVIDEVAAVGFFESLMNFMEASTGKQTEFFSRNIVQTETKANHKAALKELIARDKNHACVIAWSLMNEPETTSSSAVPYFKEIFELARELDPQKRPRTFAMVMNSTPDACKCYSFSDILSLNRYYGWYNRGGYEMKEAKELFIREMDQWKELHLNKPFIFTEFGADTMVGVHKLPSVMWSEEYQEEYLRMQFDVFDSYDFVKGEQVWNFADFQTTEGIMRVNGNKKGIFTRNRQPKAVAYVFKSRWESLPQNYKSNS